MNLYQFFSRPQPRSTLKWEFSKGILPKMGETFRLRIYNKLPRGMLYTGNGILLSHIGDYFQMPICKDPLVASPETKGWSLKTDHHFANFCLWVPAR